MLSASQAYQARVSDIPATVQKEEIAGNDRKAEFLRVSFEVLERLRRKGPHLILASLRFPLANLSELPLHGVLLSALVRGFAPFSLLNIVKQRVTQ